MKTAEVIAIVTGGASGLGEATTRRLVAQGGKVAIFDLNEQRGRALVEELGEEQCSVLSNECNGCSTS